MAIPIFVVEIISEYDDIRKAGIKLLKYFKAGIAVVRRVLP
jgi:Uma2 family endonuclease